MVVFGLVCLSLDTQINIKEFFNTKLEMWVLENTAVSVKTIKWYCDNKVVLAEQVLLSIKSDSA